MTTRSKLMMCLMALSVVLAGYISCLIASHIHWHYGWISAPALLPGLTFGLVTAGWLLQRRWIGRGKAAGLVVGSVAAYFAAYWSAFYIVVSCGKGMVFSQSRLPLFHAGMIAGVIGTALLTASLAVFSADFRRKGWKTLIIIGTAAGGALCLAGVGAKSGDYAGTLGNPGDRAFISLWQLLVGGYIGVLLFGTPSFSSGPSERGRIAQWAPRAVLILLLASFIHAAIGFSRGDKERTAASPAASGNSNADFSTPRKAAQAFDEALERNDLKSASFLAIGDEKQLAVAKARHDFAQAFLRMQVARAKKFGGDQATGFFDPDWSKAVEHVQGDKAIVNHGAITFQLEKTGQTWKVNVRAATAGASPNVVTLVQNLVKDISEITGKTEKGYYKSDKDVQHVLDAKLAALTGSKGDNASAERSHPRSEDSFAVERWLRSKLAGGMTERQIVEASDLIAAKFASPEVAEIRERCFKGTGDQRQFDGEMVYSISKGEYVPAAQPQAKRLNEEIEQMFPPRAVFETSMLQWKAKALPPIEEPIHQGPRTPGSLVKEQLLSFENAMLKLADAYLSQRQHTGKSRLSYYSDVKSLQAGDVLYCRYESAGNFFHERPYFFWYRATPPGLEDLLRSLPQDHPIRQIGPPLEEAPPNLDLAMKVNVQTAEDVKKMMAESKARAEKERRSQLTGRDGLNTILGVLGGLLAVMAARDLAACDDSRRIVQSSGGTKVICDRCDGCKKIPEHDVEWTDINPYTPGSYDYEQFEAKRGLVYNVVCPKCHGKGVLDK